MIFYLNAIIRWVVGFKIGIAPKVMQKFGTLFFDRKCIKTLTEVSEFFVSFALYTPTFRHSIILNTVNIFVDLFEFAFANFHTGHIDCFCLLNQSPFRRIGHYILHGIVSYSGVYISILFSSLKSCQELFLLTPFYDKNCDFPINIPVKLANKYIRNIRN